MKHNIYRHLNTKHNFKQILIRKILTKKTFNHEAQLITRQHLIKIERHLT